MEYIALVVPFIRPQRVIQLYRHRVECVLLSLDASKSDDEVRSPPSKKARASSPESKSGGQYVLHKLCTDTVLNVSCYH